MNTALEDKVEEERRRGRRNLKLIDDMKRREREKRNIIDI